MNEEELLRRMAALKAAGATDDEIEAFVAEHDAAPSPALPVGNPFEAKPAKPIMGDALRPSVARPAAEATGAAFHSLEDSGAAYADKQRRNLQDAKGLAATALQGATLHLADDVLPIGESVDYLKRRSPAVAGMVDMAAGLAVPGVAGAKAFRALAPAGSNLGGQALAAALLGGTGSGLLASGDATGSLEDKANAFVGGFPVGAGIGAGAVLAPPALGVAGRFTKGVYRNVLKHPVRSAGAILRGTGQIATGKAPTALAQLLRSTPIDESVPTLAEALAAQAPEVSEDVVKMIGPKRLGTVPPMDGPPPRLMPVAPEPAPTSGLPVKYPRPEGTRVSTRTDGGFAPRPPLALVKPGATATGPRPPSPTASLEGAAAPAVDRPPAPRPVPPPVTDPMEDPLLRAMAEQIKRGKPTPKPGHAVGPKPSKADRVAAMKARSLAGDVVKESELNGLTLAERIEARGGQQALDAAKATGDRREYGAYLKKHGQGSEVRRGEYDDLTRDPAKMAEKAALQAEADALPDTPEGDAARELLYRRWLALQDEYGKTSGRMVAGAGVAAGGALTAALAADAVKRKRDGRKP